MDKYEEVSEYLKNYHEHRMMVDMYRKKGVHEEQVKYFDEINECIELLEDNLKDIVQLLYIHKLSLKRCGQKLCMGTSTVFDKKERALRAIAACMKD